MTKGEKLKCELFVYRACKAALHGLPAEPQREQFEAHFRDHPRFPWRREIAKRIGDQGLAYLALEECE